MNNNSFNLFIIYQFIQIKTSNFYQNSKIIIIIIIITGKSSLSYKLLINI